MNYGSGEEETYNSGKGKGKKQHHRHSAEQIQQLEAFFKDNAHPDENQRRQLSREIGLDPKQIKFWFQNKRTQTKSQSGKADNDALRAENETLRLENLTMHETLKTIFCSSCNGSSPGEGDRQLILQKLKLENARLKEEFERRLGNLGNYTGPTGPTFTAPVVETFSNMTERHFPGKGIGITPPIVLRTFENRISPNEMEKSILIDTAITAMDELVELLRMKEPMWMISPTDGRYVLHRDSYNKHFSKPYHSQTASSRIESSIDSGEVAMAGVYLIELFLDPNKWRDMFPTIITKAETIGTLDTGNLGGSLHLMYEKMHILSPLMPPREFFFIRYCRQVSSCTWVVVDVSFDFIKELQDAAPNRSWKLPSGCMVEDKSNGKSYVTWIEHVEVDDKSLTHRLYRDFVCGSQAYGAKRWIAALQRICERFVFLMRPTSSPNNELEGVIDSPAGRRNLMKLSHRMVKDFCEMLSKTDKVDFSQLSEQNTSGVRVSVGKSNGAGQPEGLIVRASTSLWLPISPVNLFNFLQDEKNRSQWDILCNGNRANAIARISTGTHPGNCINIIQPFVTSESNMMMIQENIIEEVGGMLIYAPIALPDISSVVEGNHDTAYVPILPSGYVITSDGRTDKVVVGGGSSSSCASGSLLTVALQVLVSHSVSSEQLSMESIANVHSLLSSTIQKIKAALDSAEMD